MHSRLPSSLRDLAGSQGYSVLGIARGLARTLRVRDRYVNCAPGAQTYKARSAPASAKLKAGAADLQTNSALCSSEGSSALKRDVLLVDDPLAIERLQFLHGNLGIFSRSRYEPTATAPISCQDHHFKVSDLSRF